MATGERSTAHAPSSVCAYSIGGFAGRQVSGWRHEVRILDLPEKPRDAALRLIDDVMQTQGPGAESISDDALHIVRVEGRTIYEGGMPERVPRCVVDLERLLEEWGPRTYTQGRSRSR